MSNFQRSGSVLPVLNWTCKFSLEDIVKVQSPYFRQDVAAEVGAEVGR